MIHRSVSLRSFAFVFASLILASSAHAGARLSVSPTSFSLQANAGATVSAKTVTISNTGNGSLKWSIVPPTATWLSVSPTSGVNGGTVTLTFRTSALAVGDHQTSFRVNSSVGSSATVSVLVRILAPTTTTTTPPPTSPTTTTAPNFSAIVLGIRPRGFGVTPYTLLQPVPGRVMYYVATTGSDTNPGTSAAPFRTINRAAQAAIAGDVVTIRNGTYQGSVYVKNSGTSSARIVFQAENRGGVVLSGGQYNFQPAAWNGGKLLSGQFYITVRGLIFRGYASTVDGTSALRAATGWRIEDCFFDSPGRNGVDLRGDSIVLTKSTIQYALQHGLIAWGPLNGATSPTDSRYIGIRDLRITDTIFRGNFRLTTPLPGSSSVAKILVSRGTRVDNIESYENNGSGLWFDTANFDYVVSNSYFHHNRWAGDGFSPGRGLHLEISWAPGLVERNVFTNNAHEGLGLNNSQGVTVRHNLFIGNMRSIRMSNWDRGAAFPLKDIRLEYNQFKGWLQYGGIEPLGYLTAASLPTKNITADYNVYEPTYSAWLSGWWDIGAITSIANMRTYLRWEANGRVGSIAVPY